MKTSINMSDSRQRDSRVAMEARPLRPAVRTVGPAGQAVSNVRCIKSTLETSFAALTKACTPEELSQQLIDGDPEVDLETFGRFVRGTSQIHLNRETNEPAYGVIVKERVYTPDGVLKEEREPRQTTANVNLDVPLTWTGRLLPKKKFYNRFAFSGLLQLTHVNGLTYDFLFEMAKELEEKEAFLLMAGGERGTEPLIFQRNGKPYRGFLEGRTRGNEYLLLLHLTSLELKSIVEPEAT